MKANYRQPYALSIIKGNENAPYLSGIVKLYQKPGCVIININIKGLPLSKTGFFGFHIHEGNSCTGSNFSDTGNHYNPDNTIHPIHAGDLPPLLYCNGSAFMTVATDRFTLNEIIGKTIVIHSIEDDFTSQPSGNAGIKIGCGRIEKSI